MIQLSRRNGGMQRSTLEISDGTPWRECAGADYHDAMQNHEIGMNSPVNGDDGNIPLHRDGFDRSTGVSQWQVLARLLPPGLRAVVCPTHAPA